MKWTYDEKGKRLMQRLLVIDDDPAVTSLLKRGLSVVCGQVGAKLHLRPPSSKAPIL